MRQKIISMAAAAGLALLAVSAGAQGTGRGGFPPPPPPPSPQMRAKFQAWQKWQGSHKNVTALQQTLRGLQDLERDPQTRLNKKQSGIVLAVLNRWRSQPVLTDAQAQQVVQQMRAPLNRAQIKTLAMFPAGPRGFGGPPPGGPGSPPPPPPPGGFGGPPPGGPGGPPPPGGRFGGPPARRHEADGISQPERLQPAQPQHAAVQAPDSTSKAASG